jgi:hypothetical protein
VGGAAAFVLFGPVYGDERRERLCRLVVADARAAVVGVVEAGEGGLAEKRSASANGILFCR